MFFLQFIEDVWSVEEGFERVQQFEAAENCIRVVKTLGKHRSQSSFKLLNIISKLIKVSVKFSLINIHDIILHFLEIVHSILKSLENSTNCLGQSFSLGTTNENVIQLIELSNRLRQIQNIVASL